MIYAYTDIHLEENFLHSQPLLKSSNSIKVDYNMRHVSRFHVSLLAC